MERGARVTILCAAHAAAPPDEDVNGVRFVRRGTKLTVYREGVRRWLAARLGHGRRRRRRAERPALLHPRRDPQARRRAGAPRAPRAVAGRLPGPGRQGRLVDRALARTPALPRLPVRRRVARHPRRAGAASGSIAERIAVVHNGTDPVIPVGVGKAAHPMIAVVGRLVPHKQVEHAIDAALALRERAPRPAPPRRGRGLVGGRAARVRRRAGRRRHGRVRGPRRRDAASTRSTSRSWLLALPVPQGGLGPGGRRGRHAPDPGRGLRARRAARASRSPTALRGAGGGADRVRRRARRPAHGRTERASGSARERWR